MWLTQVITVCPEPPTQLAVNSSLPRTSLLPPPVPTDPSLKCHQNHQKQMRKYLRTLFRNVRRENISDKTAQIFSAPFGIFGLREMPKTGRRSNLDQIEQNVIAAHLSSQFFSTNVSSLSENLPLHYHPHSGRNMTHLSAGLRFVGTHLSIETSVSVPPSSPTHHWSMVSPGKETVDLTRLQVRSPPAPVGQSGCSGGGE